MARILGQRPGSYQPGPTAQALTHTNHERHRRDLCVRHRWWRVDALRWDGTGFQPLLRLPWIITWGVAPGWFKDAPLALRQTRAVCLEAKRDSNKSRVSRRL